jgi:hypothetical protein
LSLFRHLSLPSFESLAMTNLARSLVAAALTTVLAFGSIAQADVVFGNLGASGSGGLGGTNTDYGPIDTGELLLAQGFAVGASSTALSVQSVSVGLFATPATTLTVSIYSDNAGVPGSALYTSSGLSVSTNTVYTFPFSGVNLSPSTNYWIVPEGPASWYLNADDTSPTGQNSSGFTFTSTKRNRPSVGWTTPSPNLSSYAVSVQAVPEPPAIVLSGIGLASAMYVMRRRR